jgi:hypothetical protein
VAGGDRWSARRDHAIRAGWPSSWGPKARQDPAERRKRIIEAAKKRRLAKRKALCPLRRDDCSCYHYTRCKRQK